MLSECPHCGQKLRPKWVRCPRCRQLLPEGTVAAVGSGSEAPAWLWRGRWVAGAGVASLVLIGAFLAMRVQPQVAPSAARATSPPERLPADEAAPDAAPGRPVSFQALDAKRSATTAYNAGDFARALADLEAAVAAAPEDAEARNNLGQLLVRQGRSAEALPHFDEAVRIDGTHWEYRFNRARAYGLLDRWEDAVAEYRVAAQRFPDDHATLYNLGLAQLRIRDYAGAASTLEKAVVVAPDEHEFLITLGTAYVGAQQTDRARATFERFLEVAPADPEAAKVKALLQALAESAP